MLDFDELEEEAAARLEAGEDLDEAARRALGSAEAPQPFRGYALPLATRRMPGLPSVADVLARLPNLPLEVRDGSEIQMRLYIFYGAGDSYLLWLRLLNFVPSWIEVILYEWPGHGLREAEPLCSSFEHLKEDAFEFLLPVLREHARGGTAEGAPFAFLSHSMGTQLMVEVASQARLGLGLEPCTVFVLDWHPPDVPCFTAEGARMLQEETVEFMEGAHPIIAKLMRSDAREAEGTGRMWRMWQRDLQLCHEHQRPEGFHLFHCDLHAFYAQRDYAFSFAMGAEDGTPADKVRRHSIRCKIYASPPDSPNLVWRQSFDRWRRWTTKECHLRYIDVDHMGMKGDTDVLRAVVAALEESRREAFGL